MDEINGENGIIVSGMVISVINLVVIKLWW